MRTGTKQNQILINVTENNKITVKLNWISKDFGDVKHLLDPAENGLQITDLTRKSV